MRSKRSARAVTRCRASSDRKELGLVQFEKEGLDVVQQRLGWSNERPEAVFHIMSELALQALEDHSVHGGFAELPVKRR
jgi:hypothetical protein